MRTAPMMVAFALTAFGAGADELWRQDPVDSYGGLSSQDARNPGGLGWFSEVADNFDGGADWAIDEVWFWGGYASYPGEEGNTQGFTVRFYDDNNGHPGDRLYEQDVMEFTETLYYTNPNFGWGGYAYTLSLAIPFEPPAAERYWISIVAILDSGGSADEPQWSWIASYETYVPYAHQWFFDPGNFIEQLNDVSFVLFGTIRGGCPPDFNGDGLINSQDFILFLNLFVAQDPAADFNGDGAINSQDFIAFLNAFVAGC